MFVETSPVEPEADDLVNGQEGAVLISKLAEFVDKFRLGRPQPCPVGHQVDQDGSRLVSHADHRVIQCLKISLGKHDDRLTG